MIQKFRFWVSIQKNRKQGLEEILVQPSLQQHHSQQSEGAKQPSCPPMAKRASEMWPLHTLEYSSVGKKGGNSDTCHDTEGREVIKLGERSQLRKGNKNIPQYCMIPLIRSS